MSAAENLYDQTWNHLTPDSIRKFSLALDEPAEKVEAGLQSIVPALLSGVINEGSTAKGARKILRLLESDQFSTTIPANFNDGNYIRKGEHAVHGIFEPSVISHFPQDHKKLMAMLTPLVLGIISSKFKTKGLTAHGLNGFLKEQRELEKVSRPKQRLPFALASALLFAGIIAFFWILGKNNLPVATIEKDLSSLERSVTNADVNTTKEGLSLNDLATFMKSGTLSDLPKRFSLRDVRFALKSTDFIEGGEQELKLMASALKANPRVNVAIEAYVEDTGDKDENLLISENRAMLIREELIGRGIEPSRIKAEGRGVMQEAVQVYFVITKL